MSEKEEVKDEKKFNIVYQNDDVVIAFRVKRGRGMSEIGQIVKDHKGGKVPYHVALDKMVDLGMVQIEAHELLFPPIGEGDFNPQLPFDPTDIMQIEVKNNLGDEEE